MIKRILGRFRPDRGRHKATIKIDFYLQDQVTPQLYWHRSQTSEDDTIALVIYSYAHILYELAELNEVRVARELIGFVDQVCKRVVTEEGAPRRPRLPLGQLRLVKDTGLPAVRSYQMDFYELPDGSYRLEYRGSLGKEAFYLPGAFLALLQSCLDQLGDDPLRDLARRLGRLHDYYRYRRDFWDGGALTSAPAFALGKEAIKAQEAAADI
jgi:hypothetical protein